MSDVKKIATRESYGNALAELGSEHKDLVVLDADLASATKTGVFKKAHPDRFIDCGIAEGNMMGVAAGLAAAGMVPFASTFAMFAAGRAYEQVRNSIGYPHLNVKIGATHAGISVGEDGATHQCNEDIALMRTIPGMTVICPSDDVEAKAAVRAAYEFEGPVCILRCDGCQERLRPTRHPRPWAVPVGRAAFGVPDGDFLARRGPQGLRAAAPRCVAAHPSSQPGMYASAKAVYTVRNRDI